MEKILILVTAHNPLSRFDPLLRCLKEYAKLPLDSTVVIYIDDEHASDSEDLKSNKCKSSKSNISGQILGFLLTK